jgi:GntR family transcriptional regulator / MocR family aminotransferase
MAMSLRRRLALLRWAEDHDAAILEDDYDTEFRFTDRPIEPLQLIDQTGRVIYAGSLASTLLPGLRIGFLVVPPSIQHAVVAARFVADWHTSLPLQRTLAAFIADGTFARHVRRMRAVYRERHDRIVDLLRRDLADEVDVLPAAAGVHVAALARTRSIENIAAVEERAAARGAAFHPLAACAAGENKRSGLVLGFGAIATERIEEGIRRLKASLDEV